MLALDHIADHGYLLEVLFAKVCLVRAHELKQTLHHLRYPLEMAGAIFPLHHFGRCAEFKNMVGGSARRIHLLYRRSKHRRHAGSGKELEI